MNRYLIGLSALLAITACGGGDSPAPGTPNSKPEPKTEAPKTGDKPAAKPDAGSSKKAAKADWADSMGTATVSGMVKFEGEAPAPAIVDTSSDAKCSSEVADESLVVNNGGLANAVISVSKGLEGYKFAKGTGSVALDQLGCRYIPHVIAMQAGQKILVRMGSLNATMVKQKLAEIRAELQP